MFMSALYRDGKKKVENNVCKYTWRLHVCSPPCSEGVSSPIRERNRTTCRHAVNVPQYVGEGLHVYTLGLVGSSLFVCSAFFIHAHRHGWLHHRLCNYYRKEFGLWCPDGMWQAVYFSLPPEKLRLSHVWFQGSHRLIWQKSFCSKWPIISLTITQFMPFSSEVIASNDNAVI